MGDGESYTLSGNVGLPLGRRGFANLSAEYGASNPTSRSVQRADAAALVAAGNAEVRDPAQIWGAPTVDHDLKLWGNFGRFFGDGLQLYGHANYASETVTGGFFYRNPNTRAGVYSVDGGRTLLVGDVLDAQDGVLDGSAGCPVVEIVDHVPDPVAMARVLGDPNCFTFQKMFPGGFTPQFGGDAQDASVVAGLRGDTGGRAAVGRERRLRPARGRLLHPQHRERVAGSPVPRLLRPRRLFADGAQRERGRDLLRQRRG